MKPIEFNLKPANTSGRPIVACLCRTIFFLSVFLLSGCGESNSDKALDVVPSPLEVVHTLAGSEGFCEHYVAELQNSHHEFVCLTQSGRRFYVDVPHELQIENIIVTLHGAATDSREVRELLRNNAHENIFDRKLMIYPAAKVYGAVGWFGGGLWNGSGERTYRDNGCCVDNGIEDRQFISNLLMRVRHYFPDEHLSLVAISNGGMLGYDILCNAETNLEIDALIVAVGSYQVNGCTAPALNTDIAIIATEDDELIPYDGGVIDFGDYNMFIENINAGNQFVMAPSFTRTVDNFLTIKECYVEPTFVENNGYQINSEYACDKGTLETMVLKSGGHGLGSRSMTAWTQQRSIVVSYVMNLIAGKVSENEFN